MFQESNSNDCERVRKRDHNQQSSPLNLRPKEPRTVGKTKPVFPQSQLVSGFKDESLCSYSGSVDSVNIYSQNISPQWHRQSRQWSQSVCSDLAKKESTECGKGNSITNANQTKDLQQERSCEVQNRIQNPINRKECPKELTQHTKCSAQNYENEKQIPCQMKIKDKTDKNRRTEEENEPSDQSSNNNQNDFLNKEVKKFSHSKILSQESIQSKFRSQEDERNSGIISRNIRPNKEMKQSPRDRRDQKCNQSTKHMFQESNSHDSERVRKRDHNQQSSPLNLRPRDPRAVGKTKPIFPQSQVVSGFKDESLCSYSGSVESVNVYTSNISPQRHLSPRHWSLLVCSDLAENERPSREKWAQLHSGVNIKQKTVSNYDSSEGLTAQKAPKHRNNAESYSEVDLRRADASQFPKKKYFTQNNSNYNSRNISSHTRSEIRELKSQYSLGIQDIDQCENNEQENLTSPNYSSDSTINTYSPCPQSRNSDRNSIRRSTEYRALKEVTARNDNTTQSASNTTEPMIGIQKSQESNSNSKSQEFPKISQKIDSYENTKVNSINDDKRASQSISENDYQKVKTSNSGSEASVIQNQRSRNDQQNSFQNCGQQLSTIVTKNSQYQQSVSGKATTTSIISTKSCLDNELQCIEEDDLETCSDEIDKQKSNESSNKSTSSRSFNNNHSTISSLNSQYSSMEEMKYRTNNDKTTNQNHVNNLKSSKQWPNSNKLGDGSQKQEKDTVRNTNESINPSVMKERNQSRLEEVFSKISSTSNYSKNDSFQGNCSEVRKTFIQPDSEIKDERNSCMRKKQNSSLMTLIEKHSKSSMKSSLINSNEFKQILSESLSSKSSIGSIDIQQSQKVSNGLRNNSESNHSSTASGERLSDFNPEKLEKHSAEMDTE